MILPSKVCKLFLSLDNLLIFVAKWWHAQSLVRKDVNLEAIKRHAFNVSRVVDTPLLHAHTRKSLIRIELYNITLFKLILQ